MTDKWNSEETDEEDYLTTDEEYSGIGVFVSLLIFASIELFAIIMRVLDKIFELF